MVPWPFSPITNPPARVRPGRSGSVEIHNAEGAGLIANDSVFRRDLRAAVDRERETRAGRGVSYDKGARACHLRPGAAPVSAAAYVTLAGPGLNH